MKIYTKVLIWTLRTRKSSYKINLTLQVSNVSRVSKTYKVSDLKISFEPIRTINTWHIKIKIKIRKTFKTFSTF